jgi:hypothetical protein
MSTAVKQPELVPPEEKFWIRYSPHHELPLSGLTSLVAHALVIGVLLLASLRLALNQESETLRPPRMDVVQLEGGGGDGLEGLGGELGSAPGSEKTEVAQTPESSVPEPGKAFTPLAQNPSGFELSWTPSSPVPSEEKDIFRELIQDAQEQASKEPPKKVSDPPPTPPKKPVTVAGNQKNNPGAKNGGLSGPATGPGKGNKSGPGIGRGGLDGRPLTKQEIFARRWRFDLTGQAKEHAEKLDAMGIILAMPNPRNKGLLVVQDLKRRPVEVRPENAMMWKDAVKWYNNKPDSVASLARELRIPPPPAFILLLPQEREEKMAQEEKRYAESQGRNPQDVIETWFDFQLRNGTFEPVVIRQK